MKIITNISEYYLVMGEIELFLEKGFDALSPEEDEQLAQLSKAAESWELNEDPLPVQPEI